MIWDGTMAVTYKAVNSPSPFLSFTLEQHYSLVRGPEAPQHSGLCQTLTLQITQWSCTCSTERINATVIFEEGHNKQRSLLAYGLPQFAVEGAEPIDTIAVVLLKAGLHQLQELWLLCVVYCETEQSHVMLRTEHHLNIFSQLEQNRHCVQQTLDLLCGVSWAESVLSRASFWDSLAQLGESTNCK